MVLISVLNFDRSSAAVTCSSPPQGVWWISSNVAASRLLTSSIWFSTRPIACSTWVSNLRSVALSRAKICPLFRTAKPSCSLPPSHVTFRCLLETSSRTMCSCQWAVSVQPPRTSPRRSSTSRITTSALSFSISCTPILVGSLSSSSRPSAWPTPCPIS